MKAARENNILYIQKQGFKGQWVFLQKFWKPDNGALFKCKGRQSSQNSLSSRSIPQEMKAKDIVR